MGAAKLVFISAILASEAGCAMLTPRSQAEWPWKVASDYPCQKSKPGSCDANDAISTYILATSFCRQELNYYESGGVHDDGSQLLVGTVGVLSGSVLSVISKGTAAKGWSGLSGAANGIQATMDKTFSSILSYKKMGMVNQAYENDVKMLLGESGKTDVDSNRKIVFGSIMMAADCAMGSAKVDADVMQKIANLSIGDSTGTKGADASAPATTPLPKAPAAAASAPASTTALAPAKK
ncbi:hypothetical protein [Chromobacterium piscinae]|uniref:hypothetical protein n=1 Tax=Chromobacterium piscinae TaxID=686831 RepID=UPI003F818453